MLLNAIIAISLAWTPLPEDISVEIRVEPPEIPFHEMTKFIVEIEAPTGTDYEVYPPLFMDDDAEEEEDNRFGGLSQYGATERDVEPLSGDRVRVTETTFIEGVFEGVYAPEAVTIRLNGKLYKLPSPVIELRELTDEEKERAEEFNPAMPDFEPETPRSMLNRRAFWALAALALAVVIALVYALRRRTATGPVKPLDPWELALNRLRALEERGLPAKGDIDRYYVDLSAILRYYIEGRFSLHAPERTTPEFLDEMLRAKQFDEQQETFLAEFLKHCDRVKFARLVPETGLMTEHLAAVRRFVEETIPSEEPEDSAEAA